MTPDGAGGAYLTGLTKGSLGAPHAGVIDSWIARFDGAGSNLWLRQFGTDRLDTPLGLAVSLGSLFVAGDTTGSLGGPNLGGSTFYPDDAWLARFDASLTPAPFCSPAIANSTGQPGVLDARGSNYIIDSSLSLVASGLPLGSFVMFQVSPWGAIPVMPAGSQGPLCLGGAIGRYVSPGEIQSSGSTGTAVLPVNLGAIPTHGGVTAVEPGDTLRFQAWYRDRNPATTSNFTNGIRLRFL